MQKISRRNFLAASAGAALGLAGMRAAIAAAPKPSNDFDFVLLGDLHYDKLAHHDMEWLAREHPGDVHQVQNYSQITRDIVPGLFQEVKDVVTSSKVPMPFVAHIGDLVEGLCGTPELAQMQCREALALVNDAKFGIPFQMITGNHDITGPGAADAYDSILCPSLTGKVSDPKSASYFTEHHGMQFLYFDAFRPSSLDWTEKTLAGRTDKPLIFLIHMPVVPYNARANWIAFSHANEADKRKRLLNLLGRHKAVVLTGHLHKYSTVVRQTDSGPFVQLAICSVIPSASVQPKGVLTGIDQYTADLVNLEPKFSDKTLDERRALLESEKPFIRHFDYADATGYSVVSVRDGNVSVSLYNGLGRRLWKTVDLTGLLSAA
ncbi:MAG: metallophosphoesterase [Capsulimonas sp.]|uniref:metallophosphoesterase family protein n=1 Tax=Capsulimonas sp. TaxID=2494211 RepID=UPI0032666249